VQELAVPKAAGASQSGQDASARATLPALSQEAHLALLQRMHAAHRLEQALDSCVAMGLSLEALVPLSHDVLALANSMVLPLLEALLRALALRLLLQHPDTPLSRSQQGALAAMAQAAPRPFADAVVWPLFHSATFAPGHRAALGRVLDEGGSAASLASAQPRPAGALPAGPPPPPRAASTLHLLVPESLALRAGPSGAAAWPWSEARNGFLQDLVNASASCTAEAALQLARCLLAAQDNAQQQPAYGKLWLQLLKLHGAKLAPMHAPIRAGLARHSSFVKSALLRQLPEA
jgi:hypothetical protein